MKDGSSVGLVMDFSLIDNLKNKGFVYDDLEWLYTLTQKVENTEMPFFKLQDDTFGKRLKYLVETKNLKKIDGLDMTVAGKGLLINLADLDGFKKTAEKLVKDSEKNLEVARKKKQEADANKNDKELQSHIKGIDIDKANTALDQLKWAVKEYLPPVEKDLKDSEAIYRTDIVSKLKGRFAKVDTNCSDVGAQGLSAGLLESATGPVSGQEIPWAKESDCKRALEDHDQPISTSGHYLCSNFNHCFDVFSNTKKSYDEKKDEIWKKRIEILKHTGHNANIVNFKEMQQQGGYQREKGLKTWEEFSAVSLTEYFTGRGSDSGAYDRLAKDMELLRGQ